jgi:STE24 endopeptidase
VAPILLLEAAADELLNRSAWGFIYLAAAAVMWKVGSLLSLAAAGMRFNTLKSGETLGRARRIAHQMGVELERVYMVPAGRGKLINAYSLGSAIAISDSLGQHLKRSEIEFTIAHEVGHCKRKHGLRFMRMGVAVYVGMAVLLFGIGENAGSLRWLVAIAGVVIPVMICEGLSRQNEYEADAEAVRFTQNPESGIRGLSNLADAMGVSKRANSIATVLSSHPSLRNRATADARVGNLPEEQLKSILREEGILD